MDEVEQRVRTYLMYSRDQLLLDIRDLYDREKERNDQSRVHAC
jgi:hypothetical protein